MVYFGFKYDYADSLIMPVDRNIYQDDELTIGLGAIPANTVITNFLDVDQWSQTFYVTYNGVSGYISKYNCAVKSSENYNTWDVYLSSAKMYEKATTKSNIVIENISKGTSLKSNYEQYDIRSAGWIYTEYNGKTGWVLTLSEDFKNEVTSYSNLVNEYDNKEENVLDYITEKETENETQPEVNSTETVINETNETQLQDTNITGPEVNEIHTFTLTAIQLVLICIIVAILVSVTTLVTIVLVNKKKSNK